MPKLVKNYLLITYDELLDNFSGVMEKIKNCGLIVRSNIDFPLNIKYYKSNPNKIFIKKKNEIQDEIIINKANLFYEKILFPNLYNIIIELKFTQIDINKLEQIQDKYYNKILNINYNIIVIFIIPKKLVKTRVFTFYKCWRNGYCLNNSNIKIPKNIVKVILKKI